MLCGIITNKQIKKKLYTYIKHNNDTLCDDWGGRPPSDRTQHYYLFMP